MAKTLLVCAPWGVPTSTQSHLWSAVLAGSTGKTIGVAYEREHWYRHYIRTDGVISALAALRSSAGLGSDVITLNKNLAPTQLQVTTEADNAVHEGTETLDVSAGDFCTLDHTLSCSHRWVRALYEASGDNHVSLFGVHGGCNGFFLGSSISWDRGSPLYHPFCGGYRDSPSEDESKVAVKVKTAGTFKYLRVNICKNGASDAITIRSRVNGAYGNLSITIPAGFTGSFTDLANEDVLAAGDTYCLEANDVASGYADFSIYTLEYHHALADGEFDVYNGLPGYSSGVGVSNNPLYRQLIGGDLGASVNSADDVYITLGMDCGAKKFRCVVSSNTCSANQVFSVMKNGVATALSFTVLAGVTGEFIDNINEIDILATDQLCIVQTGGGTGGLEVEYFATVIPGSPDSPEEEPVVPETFFLPLDTGRDPTLRQRLVNMYTEPTPKGPTKFSRYQRPGLELIATIGSGPIRASFKWGSYRFTVSGNEVYRDTTLIGTVFGTSGPVRFAYSDEQVVIVSGGRAWLVSTTAVVEITDPDLPDNIVDVAFLAARFIYITSNDTTFYYSALNDATSIDGLNYATAAENTKDVCIRVAVLADQLVFFTTKVIEYWSPTSDITNPFVRSPGRKNDLGLAARHSVILMDNALFFVGFDKQVYRTGAVPIKVSNFEVDDYLRQASMEDLLDECFAYTVNFGGHEFYVVHIPGNGTWAYDISMKEWAEWRSWNRGRFRVLCAEDNFMGDFYTGKLMGFNGGRFVDVDGDAEPIERVTNYFHPLKNGRLPNTNVVLGCTRGTTERLEGYGSDPVVEMCYSDNEGRTYTGWRAQRVGVQGETTDYSKTVWHKLGRISPPGRHFLFRCTDPIRWSPFGVAINEVRP